jgi:hypothetical protein
VASLSRLPVAKNVQKISFFANTPFLDELFGSRYEIRILRPILPYFTIFFQNLTTVGRDMGYESPKTQYVKQKNMVAEYV